MSTLDQVKPGDQVTVTHMTGEGPLVRRLAELGLRPAAQVTVLHRTSGGGRVVDVSGSRIALGADVLRVVHAGPLEPQSTASDPGDQS